MRRTEFEQIKEALLKGARLEGIDVAAPMAKKMGFILRPVVLDNTHIAWEYVEDPNYVPVNDGLDYARPIKYIAGMNVAVGLWYTDGYDIWDAIKDGTPSGFDDSAFFNIIT